MAPGEITVKFSFASRWHVYLSLCSALCFYNFTQVSCGYLGFLETWLDGHFMNPSMPVYHVTFTTNICWSTFFLPCRICMIIVMSLRGSVAMLVFSRYGGRAIVSFKVHSCYRPFGVTCWWTFFSALSISIVSFRSLRDSMAMLVFSRRGWMVIS